MRNALSIVLLISALVFAACSGGGSDASSSLRIRCIGGQSFCVISCDLGCNQTGCSVTEIAENQRLNFKFSDAVDPASVNGASISIRTATGVPANGELEVVGSQVSFVPKVSAGNGQSSFGFLRNESYIITLAGGASSSQSVTSLSGDGLSEEFSCTVIASQGILDEDGQAPTVELLSPSVLTGAPVNPTIVLRFSELIDTAPLQVSLGEASPIRVVLRGTLPNGLCDSDSDGTALTGVPQLSTELVGTRDVTVVTFQSESNLPGESCLTVRVTSDLRDLSGRSAVPAKFEFTTEAGVSIPIEIPETFASNSQQETQVSGGQWGPVSSQPGAPTGARPGFVGGDGRHGSFDRTLGTALGGSVFVFDVDNTLIPAAQSLTGQQYLVTDGKYYFSDMVVPEGSTIRFVGSVAPVIRVRGRCEILGSIEINGGDSPTILQTTGVFANQQVSVFNAKGLNGTMATGQVGTVSECGGANGGRGAFQTFNNLPANYPQEGTRGGVVGVPAGHAYAGSINGTGGEGGSMVPATGVWPTPSTNVPSIASVFCGYFSSGGAGGGYMVVGNAPATPTLISGSAGNQPTTELPGATAAGGVPFNVLPFPTGQPVGYQSIDHFLVGGSGGGGGGSHGLGLITVLTNLSMVAGHGGTAGGGAFAIRVGGLLSVAASGVLETRGGDGPLIDGGGGALAKGLSSPGGGGSGGSILLQSGTAVSVLGEISVRGGDGGELSGAATTNTRVMGNGGNGSHGYFRLEGPSTSGGVSWSGTTGPGTPAYDAALNSGELTDRDYLSGDTSLWYSSNQVFPPTWLRYELDVDLDGDGTIDITYTDSGEPGTQRAYEVGGPVTLPVSIQFQGAVLDPQSGIPIETPGPWRPGIGTSAGQGINSDSVTGYRFTILYNTESNPDLIVRELRVIARS